MGINLVVNSKTVFTCAACFGRAKSGGVVVSGFNLYCGDYVKSDFINLKFGTVVG